MKLVRFSTNEQSPRLGALRGDRIADLEASLAATLTRRGVVRAREIAAALVPQSTRGFLEGGAAAEEAVLSISEWVTVPAASARLHAPIADPGKFICIGLNYRDHAEETGNPIPKEPPIFAKWSNSILDPGEPILRPRGSQQLDWEVELGVVIGRTARFVAREQALDYVWGYTIINDASARDFQFITSQWMAGKIFETAAPVGPYLADRKEITDPHTLDLRTWVNGKQMQSGSTRTFMFDVRYIVSYLSGLMQLAPRDRPLRAPHRPPAQPVGARRRVRVRPHPPRGAGDHARQRSRPPRALRLRPAPLSGRARRPRGARDRVRSPPGRRGRARQLLHRGCQRPHHRPARRAHSHRGLCAPDGAAARDPAAGRPAVRRARERAPLRPGPARQGP